MSERKDFPQWKVEIVFRMQDGVCSRCSNPLAATGFARHHKDGDNSNNSVENLELLCPSCHHSEQFKTLQLQKEKHLKELETLTAKGMQGEIAGAVLDKLLDSIKLALSLERQLYGTDIEEPPVAIRTENYLTSSGLLMKEYERGFYVGLEKGAERAIEMMKKRS
jgi:hypothetical protein